MENARTGWKLVTFDLDLVSLYFRVFFQLRLYLHNGFTEQLCFWCGDASIEYLGQGPVSRSRV